KYKYKGLVAYRNGHNLAALRYYFRARGYDPADPETGRLILKALVPRFMQNMGRKIIEVKRKYEFKT
ncbi:MAG: hypothetical protein K8I00_11795, partial [Candidatus Omnitrophica bacterium]|nr:hypothetical protein [Candidatus Omnitrophota bacterium]